MEAVTRQLPPGTMLDDKYRIESLLAVGGMGAVYVGTHTQLRKKVAIKILNPQLNSPAMIARFQREAITASQIGHEGIAQVTDLGTSRDGEAFLVMELLEGEPLSKRLKAIGAMAVEQACELGCAILAPLDAAHRAGVVHRDLKPDNVFLVRQSRGELIKLLDFGISRAVGLEAEMRLTTTGMVMGTPYYMSPEQARGDHELGPSSDLYSFGVILYEMLVGALPIVGENYNQLIYRVMTGDYQHARDRRPDIPQELDDVLARTMALEPDARPATAAELEHALLAFCRPAFREHVLERISSAGIVFGTSPPQREKRPSAEALRSGYGTDPRLGHGTDPTLMSPQTPVPQTPAAPTPIPAPRKRSMVPILLAAAAAVAGTVGVVVWKQQAAPEPGTFEPNADPPVTTPVPAAQPPPKPDPVPEPAPVPVPAKVTLKFAVEPKDAVIKVDGVDVANGELLATKDDAEHTLVVTARGFESHEEPVRFDENQKLVIHLERAGTPKQPTPPRHRPTKPTKPERIEIESPYK